MALVACPKCGEKVSSTAKKCIHCGAELELCPECGAEVHGTAFCPSCGKALKAGEEVRKPETPPTEEQLNKKEAEKMNSLFYLFGRVRKPIVIPTTIVSIASAVSGFFLLLMTEVIGTDFPGFSDGSLLLLAVSSMFSGIFIMGARTFAAQEVAYGIAVNGVKNKGFNAEYYMRNCYPRIKSSVEKKDLGTIRLLACIAGDRKGRIWTQLGSVSMMVFHIVFNSCGASIIMKMLDAYSLDVEMIIGELVAVAVTFAVALVFTILSAVKQSKWLKPYDEIQPPVQAQ